MSSSPHFASTPPSSLPRKSKFTYKHLNQLSHFSSTTPLRTIALIDLDAFYAQCEMVRLGIPPTQPLAVQQWQSLIAVNYPARAFGVGRHITAAEAKEKCPDLICQHVATWKEGATEWAYYDDAFKNIATHKVSLDPYRHESRKILGVIKDTLPRDLQRVEKASVDEVFLDLSAQVHAALLERYPELRGPPPYDDPMERLPVPATTAIDWSQTDELVDLDAAESEEDDPDWDDIALGIAAEIVRNVRAAVREKLKYTLSGGVARNKMLAKLGAGYKKPNAQTVIRNRAVQKFLSGFKFTKIRMLGGKLGDEIVEMFKTEEVTELLDVPLDQLKKLGDDTGSWVYSTIRGDDTSEVNPRTKLKSMLSAKSFRPHINSWDQAEKWIRIFAADIFGRCIEEGVVENKRRPKTINLHHRCNNHVRSKQLPIPQGKTLTGEVIFELAKQLLGQIVGSSNVWPCSNLSLSIGGFEDGVLDNKGIGAFLVRGDEARAMNLHRVEREDEDERLVDPRSEKRRRIENDGIQKFFSSKTSLDQEESIGDTMEHIDSEATPSLQQAPQTALSLRSMLPPSNQQQQQQQQREARIPAPEPHAHLTYRCDRCAHDIKIAERNEHEDWHFAKSLQDELREEDRPRSESTPQPSSSGTRPKSTAPATRGRGRPPGSTNHAKANAGMEKGQRRLMFGRGGEGP